jgi:CheY-like chemotaxis protein
LARKILLADDSVTAQNMGRKILADAGYDVVTVNNGSAALKRITEVKPDLIVLDVYMPGYSGLEVCQRLKDAAETAHIPVLLTVGKLEPFKPEEARRVRADAHIVKPFEASELLTAITRLEDRMVPQQSEGGRFSTSVSGVERFGGDSGGRKSEDDANADTGWKSRLRFPSKKKKEPEPEPEEVAEGATFRDFKQGKNKAGPNAITVKNPTPPGQEPGLVPDIPRDITPEELDALSALAAKLDGPIPEAENIAPIAETMGPAEVRAAELETGKTEAAEVEAPKTEPEVSVDVPVIVPVIAAQSEGQSAETNEKKKEEVEAPAAIDVPAAIESEVPAIEAKREVEIPVEHVEPAAAVTAATAQAAATEIQQPEISEQSHDSETPAAPVTVPVSALAEEAAPVDENDEPTFASTAASETPAAAGIEVKTIEAVAASDAPETNATAEAAGPLPKEPEPAQPAPHVASAPDPVQPEEPAPSDEELAEALRLLTPSTVNADISNLVPSHGTLVAAGQLLAEEAARNAAIGPRWIAEAVRLSPEEAAMSLEAEMFRTFASVPASSAVTSAPISVGEIKNDRISGVSAIAAAVENRLAEAGLAPSAKAAADRGSERLPAHDFPTDYLPNATRAETSIAEDTANAARIQPVSSAEPEGIEAEKTTLAPPAIKVEAAPKDSLVEAEQSRQGEAAPATLADAMSNNEAGRPAEHMEEPASTTVAASPVAEAIQESSPDSGGEDVKSKSGKSNWHQIRTAPTGAGSNTDVVEAAKQAEAAAAEAPKAMAAAAAADGSSSSSTSTSVTDAGTIASIVDSVMADLRPKIVEEIARKLAGK